MLAPYRPKTLEIENPIPVEDAVTKTVLPENIKL
jgi:hypothetical protein